MMTMGRRAWIVGAVVVALATSLLGGLAGAQGGGGVLLGVYYGNQGWAMDDVRALEAWQGRRHAVVNLFTNWDGSKKVQDNLFGQQLPAIWGNGNVPLITWEPFTGSTTPDDVEQRIASGAYDAYVAGWAGRLATFLAGPDRTLGTADDRRAYLRPAHEVNGNWYPWSAAVGNNSPSDYVAMWRRLHAAFARTGVGPTQLQWVWAVNNEDVPSSIRAESFFPGDDVVDWVAVDGYNWGASQPWSHWQTPAEVLDPMVRRIRAISARPMAVTETASSSATTAGSSQAQKSAWIGALFDYAVGNGIRMVAGFDVDKETDWAVFGGQYGDAKFTYKRRTYRGYSAYRTAVSRPEVIASTGNGRLLSDAQFAGTGG